MNLARDFRKWHKWLSLFVGIQAFIWLLSGVYMVSVDIDFIHGDHLVQKLDEPLPSNLEGIIPVPAIETAYSGASGIYLASWMGEPYYRIYGLGHPRLVNARTGDEFGMLSHDDARRVAAYHFAQDGEIVSVTLIDDEAEKPTEIAPRALPLYQVSFNDSIATNFYVSPYDGRLVTRRHSLWRAFDFFWMLHIMDYDERADVNNNLLRVVAVLGTVLSVVGLGLLFYSFNGKKKNSPKKRSLNMWMRVTHKWVGLILGIQVFLWMISGFVMSWYEHDVVEGNHLRDRSAIHHSSLSDLSNPASLIANGPEDTPLLELSAYSFREQSVYSLRTNAGIKLYNAQSLDYIPIDETLARDIALDDFTGEGSIVNVSEIMAPDLETRESVGPAWRVDFNNADNSSLYISKETGAIWERRNDTWRSFDFFWMLHIMDFKNRKDFNTVWVIFFSWVAVWIGLSGMIMTVQSLQRGEFSFRSVKR